jgi:transposase
MMGTKVRVFALLPPVSLEELVPSDHFYRHLERTLDLGFVRELVRDAYANIGRPSIDPVVFFKLQLILFFEGLRSERQLLRVVADRLSLRWYLGPHLPQQRAGLRVIRVDGALVPIVPSKAFIARNHHIGGVTLVWGQ